MHATALGSCACCGHGLGLQGDNRVGQVPAGREHPVPPGFGAIRSLVLSLAAFSAEPDFRSGLRPPQVHRG